jgi:hypothetical protein
MTTEHTLNTFIHLRLKHSANPNIDLGYMNSWKSYRRFHSVLDMRDYGRNNFREFAIVAQPGFLNKEQSEPVAMIFTRDYFPGDAQHTVTVGEAREILGDDTLSSVTISDGGGYPVYEYKYEDN